MGCWSDRPEAASPEEKYGCGANKQGAGVLVGQRGFQVPGGRERGDKKEEPSCVASGLMCSAQGEKPWPGTGSGGQGLGRSALWRKAGLCCVSETPSPQAGALG